VTSLDISGNYSNYQSDVETALFILLRGLSRKSCDSERDEDGKTKTTTITKTKTQLRKRRSKLRELFLDNVDLSHGNARLLGQFIANTMIESLGLASCRLNDSGIQELVAGITVDAEKKDRYFLQKIDLSYNNLTDFLFLEHFLGPSHGFQLESINLTGNRPCKATFIKGCGFISNSIHLQSLVLENCALDHVCACVLFERLSLGWKHTLCPPVQRLGLSNNLIGHRGATSLAKALKICREVHPLREVNLSNNHIGDIGATNLSRVCTGDGGDARLIYLNIRLNGLSEEALKNFDSESSSKGRPLGMLPLHLHIKLALVSAVGLISKKKQLGLNSDICRKIFSYLRTPFHRTVLV
jgi:hypothetical protein